MLSGVYIAHYLLTAVIAIYFANPVFADSYDARRDFSNTQNPNGVWSYQGVTTGTTNTGGSYLLDVYGEIDSTGIYAWIHDALGGDFLSIGDNNVYLGVHPGEGEDALLAFEWQKPEDGLVNLRVVVDDGSETNEGNGQKLSVWKNDTILEGPIDLPPVFENFNIGIQDVSLATGDQLFVRLAADETGTHRDHDSIDLNVVISTAEKESSSAHFFKVVGTYFSENGGTTTFQPLGTFSWVVGEFAETSDFRRVTPSQGAWRKVGKKTFKVTTIFFLTEQYGDEYKPSGLIVKVRFLAEFDDPVNGKFPGYRSFNGVAEAFLTTQNPTSDEPYAVTELPDSRWYRIVAE
jgi:hypothetical protein